MAGAGGCQDRKTWVASTLTAAPLETSGGGAEAVEKDLTRLPLVVVQPAEVQTVTVRT